MKVAYIEAFYNRPINIDLKTLNYLKKYPTIAMYSSIQFLRALPNIEQQLKKAGIKVITSQPKRTAHSGQLLGCDVDEQSLKLTTELQEAHAFLYIGDGKFHPFALLYALEGTSKELICYDPFNSRMEIMEIGIVQRNNKKNQAALAKFYHSQNIGVLISIKPGQQFLKQSLELKQKYPQKTFYYFIDDKISFDQLENFPFIDVWINTACPRIGLDDIDKFRKGVVNLRDVYYSK
ncbi:diphthamide synthesis protein [Candidatus Woesearchaeota archaeon]|nr:diphthamide synthesis protein [Candidatus Woesearchaeota archaeon]